MNFIELFAGIGGFRKGLEDTGHPYKCVYANEWDKYATQIYEKNFREKPDTRDIRTVPAGEIPDHELLTAGFPCQSFSIAGKRLGFEDTRGTMFFEIARILKEKRSRYLLLENVKGLLSHDSGKTFQTILRVLSDIGYGVQWQVLNSKDFGVPQNRERVFIIGHLRGTPRPEVFPITGEIGQTPATRDVAGTLQADYWKRDRTGGYVIEKELQRLNNPKHSNDRVYSSEGICPSLNTMQGGNRQPKTVIPVLTPNRENKRQNGRRFKSDGEDSFTLTGQDKHGIAIYDDYNSKWKKDKNTCSLTTNTGSKCERNGQKLYDGTIIRLLTPTECEKLQAFPGDWTKYGADEKEISDTQRYKVLGNAVTTSVITAIGEKLRGGNVRGASSLP